VKPLVICSGGLASVTLAHKVAAERTFTCLSVPHDVIAISAVGCLPTGSTLTSRRSLSGAIASTRPE
jgi:hypothetical protein